MEVVGLKAYLSGLGRREARREQHPELERLESLFGLAREVDRGASFGCWQGVSKRVGVQRVRPCRGLDPQPREA